jgi:hypothetical protein
MQRHEDQARAAWAWWGAAAGLLGAVATTVVDPQASLSPGDRASGASIVEQVDRGGYHLGAVLGFGAVGCLIVAAVGWWRWAERSASASLAARVVGAGMLASAGALVLGYGFKGLMAVYLPGGINDDDIGLDGLYTLFMINDLGPYMAWWGVAVSAAAVAWLALCERRLPRWMGVVSVLALLPPLLLLTVTGLTGLAGVTGPVWLTVVSVGMALRGSDTSPTTPARRAATPA